MENDTTFISVLAYADITSFTTIGTIAFNKFCDDNSRELSCGIKMDVTKATNNHSSKCIEDRFEAAVNVIRGLPKNGKYIVNIKYFSVIGWQ